MHGAGVMIQHTGVVNLLQYKQATYNFKQDDLFLQQSSVAFDMTLAEIWLPFVVGGAILPAEARAQQDAPHLLRQMSSHPISVVCPVPSELSMWLECGLCEAVGPHIRYILTGGEALSHGLLQRCRKALPKAIVVQMYGPTGMVWEADEYVPNTISCRLVLLLDGVVKSGLQCAVHTARSSLHACS